MTVPRDEEAWRAGIAAPSREPEDAATTAGLVAAYVTSQISTAALLNFFRVSSWIKVTWLPL